MYLSNHRYHYSSTLFIEVNILVGLPEQTPSNRSYTQLFRFACILSRSLPRNTFRNIQGDRAIGCQGECDLCADLTSPCQNCFEGNPSATVCDDPEKYLFWDNLHFTTGFHQILAEAIRQCAKDEPSYNQPWVAELCPLEV